MIYPEFLKEKDVVGVTAPSDGITKDVDLYRLDSAINKLRCIGFDVIETENVRKSFKGASSSSKTRANELEKLYKNDNVKAIICASGGDFLLEMLSEFNFNIVKNNLKWLQGYSDPTGLLFTITTNLDIATIYGDNFRYAQVAESKDYIFVECEDFNHSVKYFSAWFDGYLFSQAVSRPCRYRLPDLPERALLRR